MNRTPRDALWQLPVVVATLSLLWIVPVPRLAAAGDPSYWGVAGYLAVAAVIAARALGIAGSATERRWLVGLLAGMPLVYLANAVRFGAAPAWVGIELAGVAAYGLLAWLSVNRWPGWLPLGIAGHAAWDLAHYTRADFVPDWYVVGCVVIDVAVAVYATGRLRARSTGGDTGD